MLFCWNGLVKLLDLKGIVGLQSGLIRILGTYPKS